MPAQRPVLRVQRSTFVAAAAAEETDGAAVLQPQSLAADVRGRGLHQSHGQQQTYALADADAVVVVQHGSELSAVTHRQPAPMSGEQSVTKTELRARRAQKVRQQGPAQSQHRIQGTESSAQRWDAQPSPPAPAGLPHPGRRQHGNEHDSTCKVPIAHGIDAEQSVPAQPTQPSTLHQGALNSPAHGCEGRPSRGKSAVILTAKGTTIELHSRSVSRSGWDHDSEPMASNDGGARSAARQIVVEETAICRGTPAH